MTASVTGYAPKRAGLGFFADLGVTDGKPKTTLTVSQGLRAQAGQASINAERNKLQDEIDKLKTYPVLNVGVSYAF